MTNVLTTISTRITCALRCISPLLLLTPVLLFGSGAAVSAAQGFGLPLMKSKTTLQRKLPAMVQLPVGTVNVIVTAHTDSKELADDFRSMLGSQLLKEDPRLSVAEEKGDSTIDCKITAFEHPPATTSTRPGVQTGKTPAQPIAYTRVTGLMRVSFQARTRSGKTIGSDNILAKYDEEFDKAGNTVSGGIGNAFKNGFNRIKGGAKSEDMNPPTDAELRTKLINSAVQQIVVQLVNTRETVEVLLAKGKGAMDEGVRNAEGGLWSRALEAWETMPPLARPIDDAYRLYDIGVANEAMAYASEDYTSATKFLDEAAINYGKAIDSNPAEKYFIEPQKRIESALAHYHKLEQQSHTPTPPPPSPPAAAAQPEPAHAKATSHPH
jgi:hypothetical protein